MYVVWEVHLAFQVILVVFFTNVDCLNVKKRP